MTKAKHKQKSSSLGALTLQPVAQNANAKKCITGKLSVQKIIDVIAGMPETSLNQEDARAMIKHIATMQAQTDGFEEEHNGAARGLDSKMTECNAKVDNACRAKTRTKNTAHNVEIEAARAATKTAEKERDTAMTNQIKPRPPRQSQKRNWAICTEIIAN